MGMRPASITACTCCWLPAVILDRNHTASCREEQTHHRCTLNMSHSASTATGEITGVIYEIRHGNVLVSSSWLDFTRIGSDGECVCVCLTLLIFSLGCASRLGKWERTSQLSTTWVCSSVPVTMFPTALSAAVWTEDTQTLLDNGFVLFLMCINGIIFTWTLTSWWLSSGTRKGTTPESITIWICSLPPSVRYDRAHTVSTRI